MNALRFLVPFIAFLVLFSEAGRERENEKCNDYCRCSIEDDNVFGNSVICSSWENFIQVGRSVASYALSAASVFVSDPDQDGIEFIDVKDQPSEETEMVNNAGLRRLVVDPDQMHYSRIREIKISNDKTLKFINPNFFKIFGHIHILRIYSNINLRQVPVIPGSVPVEYFYIYGGDSLEIIEGCGEEVCFHSELKKIEIRGVGSDTLAVK